MIYYSYIVDPLRSLIQNQVHRLFISINTLNKDINTVMMLNATPSPSKKRTKRREFLINKE